MKKLIIFVLLFFIFCSTALAGKSYSSGGSKPSFSGKSYGSGKPSFSPSKPSFSPKPSPALKPAPSVKPNSGKSYSSGGSSGFSTPPSIDKSGVEARQKQQSQRRFEQSQAPAKTYKDPKTGQSKPVDQASATKVRKTITVDKYVYRENRINDFYSPYVGRPVVYYSDPFGPFFWLWLMDRSAEERALWAYHHRSQMDQARYAEMLKKDAELEARLRAMEQKGVKPDSAYVPTALENDPDLMYNDDYVHAAYNPTTSIWSYIFWGFSFIVIGFVLFVLIWFIFFREIPGS